MKYDSITQIPAISHNLLTIVKILREEDKMDGKYLSPIKGTDSEFESTIHGGMNESMEFFIENKIIETLSAYAITDQP